MAERHRSVLIALVLSGLAAACVYTDRRHLFEAIKEHDEAKVRALLDSGVPVDTETYLGVRALSLAAWDSDPTMVRVLLEYGVSLDEPRGELALRTAANWGSAESVRLLLEAGVNPNARYYTGGTTLMDAIEKEQVMSVEVLLEYGADPNLRGRYSERYPERPCGGTALLLASKSGNLHLVRLLLAHHADPTATDESGCSPLQVARGPHQAETVSLLRNAIAGLPARPDRRR